MSIQSSTGDNSAYATIENSTTTPKMDTTTISKVGEADYVVSSRVSNNEDAGAIAAFALRLVRNRHKKYEVLPGQMMLSIAMEIVDE